MQNSHKALWDNCLHLIKQNVTEQTFKTWFEPIVFESYNEEQKTVLVQVPSPYVYEYLEQYYVQLMGWALRQSFKAKVRLTYRIVTDKEHNIIQNVEGEQKWFIFDEETQDFSPFIEYIILCLLGFIFHIDISFKAMI